MVIIEHNDGRHGRKASFIVVKHFDHVSPGPSLATVPDTSR